LEWQREQEQYLYGFGALVIATLARELMFFSLGGQPGPTSRVRTPSSGVAGVGDNEGKLLRRSIRRRPGSSRKTKIVSADCGAQFTGLAFTALTGTKRGIAISMDGGMSSRPVRRATHP
jgi:hypothetical protein